MAAPHEEFPEDLKILGFTAEQESEIFPKENETDEEAAQRELKTLNLTDPEKGLPLKMVERRQQEFGFNELPEKHVHPLIKFLTYFTLPMPIMIWIAALIELIKAGVTGEGWEDFVVLMILQIVNGTVGFIEEKNAGNAVAALKAKLCPECYVCRGGQWATMPSRLLVPGDLIELKIGDVVPADAMLLPGQALQVDQSALTGESLPVTIYPMGKAKMGSAIKRGETKAVVCGTGRFTFFGKAAELLNQVVVQGRFQKIIFRVTIWLLLFSVLLVVIIFIKLMVSSDVATVSTPGYEQRPKVLSAISTCVVLLVASIPIAIELVSTTTMAMGSRRLAERKVIVARLSAIEELAGMTILCSDKTGTLTQNKLSLNEPILFHEGISGDDLVFYAALCSKRGGGQDAIDFCMTQSLTPANKTKWETYKELEFVPFNPTDKRTESTVQHPDGRVFKASKGAPQVILNMTWNSDEIRPRVEAAVQELADRGFRALGVAVSWSNPGEEEEKWEFMGVLSVFDPPRVDAVETIRQAHENMVEVKMITGDQAAIAKETCRMLGMGTNILTTSVLNGNFQHLGATLDEVILNANGFAEVYPEHKFQIVEALRKMGYVVGMTGDGVNDAPALKRADIGIAVEGATDAAKAAADIVLVEPGLSVIIEAIFRSRKIFQRMRNYVLYRVACTIQLLVFFFFAILTVNPNSSEFYGNAFGGPTCIPDHAASFTLPVIALIVITILNDGAIITVAYDRVKPESTPQQWNLREVTILATVLGLFACLSSLIFLVLVMAARHDDFIARACSPSLRSINKAPECQGPESQVRFITWGEAQTLVYLKISLSDFLTLFSSRVRSWFFTRRPSYALFIALVLATTASTLLALWWPFPAESAEVLNMHRINNGYGALFTWIYVIIWFIGQDVVKVVTYWILEKVHFEDKSEASRRMALQRISSAIETDNKKARAVGVATDSTGSFRYAREGSMRGGPLKLAQGSFNKGGSFRAQGSLSKIPIEYGAGGIVSPAGSFRSVQGATVLENPAGLQGEVRYLRDRVKRLESVVDEMRTMLAAIMVATNADVGGPQGAPPPLPPTVNSSEAETKK